MMRPNANVEKVYLYPKPVDFRKSIDGLAALVELDIQGGRLRPRAFRVSESPPQSGQGVVLGAQRILPMAQAPGSRTIQNLTR